LKTDIFHSGKEDAGDDHKFITERMLDVAIPDNVPEGQTITLEMCLEEYFNNRVEVKRHLQRANTARSTHSIKSMDKSGATHLETVELGARPESPIHSEPPIDLTRRPTFARLRGTGLFSDRKVETEQEVDETKANDLPKGRRRTSSLKKEVLMPAWQFLNLIRT